MEHLSWRSNNPSHTFFSRYISIHKSTSNYKAPRPQTGSRTLMGREKHWNTIQIFVAGHASRTARALSKHCCVLQLPQPTINIRPAFQIPDFFNMLPKSHLESISNLLVHDSKVQNSLGTNDCPFNCHAVGWYYPKFIGHLIIGIES